jgi:hypothetical protein
MNPTKETLKELTGLRHQLAQSLAAVNSALTDKWAAPSKSVQKKYMESRERLTKQIAALDEVANLSKGSVSNE